MSAPHRPPAPHLAGRRRAAFGAAATALVVALSGCGLRLETPPPVEPSPGAVEQVRARTVDDAVGLAQDARSALGSAPAGPVAEVLTDVAAFGDLHAQQLGGVYDSGLPDPTPSPTATASSSTPTAVAPEAVLEELASDARTALGDADAVADGPLARLVGSVATSRADLARRLAAALGAPAPELAVPDAGEEAAGTDDAASPAGPDATDDADASDGTGTDGADGAAAPDAAPAGLTRTDLDALTLAHDEAGYGLEVVAAKLTDAARATARDTAALHRQEASRWAEASGASGTADDPRRVAYALPAGLEDPAVTTALARTLETGVADTYGHLLASADPGSRAALLDGLRAATERARAWGATPVAFPGMPELAAAAPTPAATEG